MGQTLLESLGNQAPWKDESCTRPNCKPCQSKPGSCLRRNCTYRISCQTCQKDGKEAIYWGETHRAWGDRQREHENALRNNNETYAIVKHQLNVHPDQPPAFEYKFHQSWKTSLDRQIGEALLINEANKDTLLNSRSEWGHNSVPRLVVHKDNEPPDPTPHPDALETTTNTRRPPETDHQNQSKAKRPREDPILTPAAQPKFKNSKHQMTDYFIKTKTTKGENLLLTSPKPSGLPGRSEEFLKDHNKLTMRLNNWPIEGQDTDTLSLRNFPSQE